MSNRLDPDQARHRVGLDQGLSRLQTTKVDGMERGILNLEASATILPAKSNSDVMFFLQSYQELRID